MISDQNFNKILIGVNSAIPLFLLLLDAWRERLGANPIEYMLRATGVLTLIFLGLTLAITPIRKISGYNFLVKYRRELGVITFIYSFAHFLIYFVFNESGSIRESFEDAINRPFIFFGFTAFLIMIPLAITSTNSMIKRLGGKRWARLHRLVYLVAVLGVIHFWLIVKSDVFYPAVAALILVFLLGYRIYDYNKRRTRGKH